MTYNHSRKLDRREFLKQSVIETAALTATLGAKPVCAAKKKRSSVAAGKKKKVIVIGIDGMDPQLSERLIDAGLLPNFKKLRELGGYRRLGTSIPPQSPVAWANFMTGAGPGTHGIFDFVHRDLQNQNKVKNSVSYTKPGKGAIGVGEHLLQLNFWPFNHTPPRTVLARKGVPFWEYLDEADISSHIYMVPSNFPPSHSKYGHHFSLSGLGTPDIMGTIGTYQYFVEDRPIFVENLKCMKLSDLVFKNDTAQTKLLGPLNIFMKKPESAAIKFVIHRDRQAKAAVIEIQNHKILLKQGQWSHWIKVDFKMSMPVFVPDKRISGICRFYLQKVAPNFRLHVSPININPADPAMQISEPPHFSEEISKELGLFYTLGFQESYQARDHNAFNDEEFAEQANMVLQERLRLLEYAMEKFEDGVLFFYFSSTDLQSHIFWWDSYERHTFRSRSQAMKYNNHIKELYKKMDSVLGEILECYGDKATIFALSDHGFSYFKRKFNLNTWLRKNGYIKPSYCTTLYPDKAQTTADLTGGQVGADWSKTKTYALGLNGLYLNLKGREQEGIVEPKQREGILQELIAKLEAVRDVNGKSVIRKAYRSDQIYSGPQIRFAPDIIIGYYRGYRSDNQSGEGDMRKEVLRDNKNAWSADHCIDPCEVPGVLFCNRPIQAQSPNLIDLAPTILAEFGLSKPATMTGKNVFTI